jgi:hypothetical protein
LPWRIAINILCFLLISLAAASHANAIAADGQSIRLISSDDSPFARATARRLQELLEPSTPGITLEKSDGTYNASTASRFVVAVGESAWNTVLAASPRDVALLAVIPGQNGFEVAAGRSSRSTSAIMFDQPIGRLLNLVTLVKPQNAQLGVVLGPNSEDLAAGLQQNANERKQRLHVRVISEEASVGKAFADVIRNSDVLLAIPDPVVHNANTVQPILLMSYHAGVPVIGYSAAYQRAGAMVVLYTTPEQLARQVAEAVMMWREGKGLPAPQSPKYFTVGVNVTVARSLGISLSDAETLEQKLHTMKE